MNLIMYQLKVKQIAHQITSSIVHDMVSFCTHAISMISEPANAFCTVIINTQNK
jgi:hypothetical protein